VLQFGTTGALSAGGSVTNLGHNYFFDGTNPIYLTASNASLYQQTVGQHRWFNAPSGSIGGTVTFTQAMTLDASGNLLVGSATSSGERLQVTGTAKITGASSFGGNIIVGTLGLGTGMYWNNSNNRLAIGIVVAESQLHVRNATGCILTLESTNAGSIATPVETSINLIGYGSNLQAQISSQDRATNIAGGRLVFRVKDASNVLQDRFNIERDGLATFSGAATITGNLTVDTNTLFVDATNDRVGIGTITPDARLRVASASANATQAIFGNVDGRGLLIATSSIAGTNDAGTILNARGATSGTFIFQTDGTQRMQLDANGLEFPNNRGLLFDNSSASAVGSIKMGTGTTNPLEITNGTNTITLVTIGTAISSNLLVGAFNVGTSATNTLVLGTGTAPSSSPTDVVQMYSADITAGNAAPHFRTENGAVIKLYQQDNGVAAANYVAGIGSAVTTLDAFDGYTIGQVVKALRNAGILS
jgi:hypothetical protein